MDTSEPITVTLIIIGILFIGTAFGIIGGMLLMAYPLQVIGVVGLFMIVASRMLASHVDW